MPTCKYSPSMSINTKCNRLEKLGINNIVAAIGVFDGIHLGHRAIINRLLAVAKEYDAAPIVITFHPHPRHFLIHQSALRLLRSQKTKAKLLARLGIKAVITLNFAEDISSMTPEQFVDYLTESKSVKLRAICVGETWKFGAAARGNVELLGRLTVRKDIELYPVEQVYLDGISVSSTRIRKELASARFEVAYKMLDDNYRMEGRIINTSKKTGCTVDYGIVPRHPGCYEIELFTNSKTISLNAVIDEQGIRENLLWIQDINPSEINDGECVEIFFKQHLHVK